jgi:hypothetical protein
MLAMEIALARALKKGAAGKDEKADEVGGVKTTSPSHRIDSLSSSTRPTAEFESMNSIVVPIQKSLALLSVCLVRAAVQ